MDAKRIGKLIKGKSGRAPKVRSDEELGALAEFLAQPEIATYLRECLPDEVVGASCVRVLSLPFIKEEMAAGAAPGSLIRPYGYLVFAASVGGNVICVHNPSGRVFWVDHISFSGDLICYIERDSGKRKYLKEYNAANVEKAMVLLSESMERFLEDLLSDRLTEQLDELD